MANVLKSIEILPFNCLSGCTNVTNDRQTEGRAIAYSERERSRSLKTSLFGLYFVAESIGVSLTTFT